jgi:hypothetical protein
MLVKRFGKIMQTGAIAARAEIKIRCLRGVSYGLQSRYGWVADRAGWKTGDVVGIIGGADG